MSTTTLEVPIVRKKIHRFKEVMPGTRFYDNVHGACLKLRQVQILNRSLPANAVKITDEGTAGDPVHVSDISEITYTVADGKTVSVSFIKSHGRLVLPITPGFFFWPNGRPGPGVKAYDPQAASLI